MKALGVLITFFFFETYKWVGIENRIMLLIINNKIKFVLVQSYPHPFATTPQLTYLRWPSVITLIFIKSMVILSFHSIFFSIILFFLFFNSSKYLCLLLSVNFTVLHHLILFLLHAWCALIFFYPSCNFYYCSTSLLKQ